MEDIKTGKYYHVRGYVGYKNENEVSVTFCNKLGVQTSIDFEPKEARKLFSPISEQPKYDPNREFREGDKVRVRKIHGKLPQCRYNGIVRVKDGDCCTIHKNGGGNCYWVTISEGIHWCFDAAYLELVTPVEELEPYEVRRVDCYWSVIDKNGVEMSRYWLHLHPHAKEAAEAECDRLNSEHRKGATMRMCLTCKYIEHKDISRYVCTHICTLKKEIVAPHGEPCEKYEKKEQK